MESKKNRRDYGLTLGDMITNAFCGKRAKPTKKFQKGDCETTPLLNNKADTTGPNGVTNVKATKEAKPGWSQILSSQSILVLLAYGGLALHSLAFDSVLPVFLNHPVTEIKTNPDVKLPFKFTGGFGMGKWFYIDTPHSFPRGLLSSRMKEISHPLHEPIG